MERNPITSSKAIEIVQAPLRYEDLLPDYRYNFVGEQASEEAEEKYNELLDFININDEIAVSFPYTSRSDYTGGFARALAMVRLWFESQRYETES